MADKGTTKRQVITPSEAQEIETHELYYDQRPINHARVRKYGTAMKLGGWLPRSVLSFCVTPDGQRFLVNGRRRINAVIWANVPIEFDVQILPVANVEDIGTWYAHFDDHERRSLDERMKAFHAEARCNFNKAQTKHLRACYPLILPGFRAAAEMQGHIAIDADSPELRLAFIEAWADEAERYYADTKGSRHKITTNLRRSPIEAVALVTYRHTGNDAEEFWHQVAHDDGLGEFDPRKKLHVFLGSTMSGEYSPDEMARYAASAWCAWWEERTLQVLRAQSSKNPIVLAGTPHDGKRWLNYISPLGAILEKPEPDTTSESHHRPEQVNLITKGRSDENRYGRISTTECALSERKVCRQQSCGQMSALWYPQSLSWHGVLSPLSCEASTLCQALACPTTRDAQTRDDGSALSLSQAGRGALHPVPGPTVRYLL